MKKIITAINNPKLNEELKKEKKFEIIGKDIQYKEAILEILEKNKNIDIIIISEKISGEIKIEELIKKIKFINEKIKIIFILEKENNDIEKILIKNNIIDIYYNNKINLEELIKIINKKEINMEEEIIKLKKIIEEKNLEYSNLENNIETKKTEKNKKIKFEKKHLRKIKEIIKKGWLKEKDKVKKMDCSKNMLTKIITFSGNYKSGKSTLALIVSHYLSIENNKVLLIDGDLEKQDLSIILKNKNEINFKKRKKNKKNGLKNNLYINEIIKNNLKTKNSKINNLKINNLKIKKFKKIKNKINSKKIKLIDKKFNINYYKIKNKINLFSNKLNKNLYFFNGLNYILKNEINKKEKIAKKMILEFLKIEKKNYDFIIFDLSKNNTEMINKEIVKNSYINFMVMEPNLLGIKEIQNLLTSYLNNWKSNQKSLHIVINKKNFNAINKNLISKNILLKNKIYEISENKIYSIIINNYSKMKFLLKNKKIKKEINKIILKIRK